MEGFKKTKKTQYRPRSEVDATRIELRSGSTSASFHTPLNRADKQSLMRVARLLSLSCDTKPYQQQNP
jgi:hypothetical protein